MSTELDKRPDRCNEKDGDGRTPIYYACLHHQEQAAVLLIYRGAVVDAWQLARDGMTAALETALKLNPSRLEERGGPRNETPIYYSCKSNRIATSIMLIRRGAVADIWQLARDNKPEILEAALDQDKGRIEERGGSRNETVLWYAVKNNRMSVVLMLLMKGAMASQDLISQSLAYALEELRYDAVPILIARGGTPLPNIHIMAGEGHTAVVTAILKINPNLIHEKDSHERTALDVAYENLRAETVSALIALGALKRGSELSVPHSVGNDNNPDRQLTTDIKEGSISSNVFLEKEEKQLQVEDIKIREIKEHDKINTSMCNDNNNDNAMTNNSDPMVSITEIDSMRSFVVRESDNIHVKQVTCDVLGETCSMQDSNDNTLNDQLNTAVAPQIL